MLKNYLTIALRYIVRHKVFTLINISGLTLGITCSLLIVLYIQDELAYDRFHRDADRIYRLTTDGIQEGKIVKSSAVGFPVGPTMAANHTDVESYLRLTRCRLGLLINFGAPLIKEGISRIVNHLPE